MSGWLLALAFYDLQVKRFELFNLSWLFLFGKDTDFVVDSFVQLQGTLVLTDWVFLQSFFTISFDNGETNQGIDFW